MILAIDPGPSQSACVLWDGSRVISREILPNLTMNSLVSGCAQRDTDSTSGVHLLAIEKIASYGMAVGAEVFETVFWTGRFVESWLSVRDGCQIRIPRGEIKIHLCRSMKAKDANIRQALIDRFGAPGTKKAPGALYGVTSHCWAALAVAVCAYDRMQIEGKAA